MGYIFTMLKYIALLEGLSAYVQDDECALERSHLDHGEVARVSIDILLCYFTNMHQSRFAVYFSCFYPLKLTLKVSSGLSSNCCKNSQRVTIVVVTVMIALPNRFYDL